MAKFSVIVSVYAINDGLNKCIDSILKQTYNDYEIIVVTNGNMPDVKTKVSEDYNEYLDKIKIINGKSKNYLSIKSKAITKASGDYILFINSEDYIEKGLLKVLSSKLKDSPDIIRFQVKEIHDDKICMNRELPFETVSGNIAFKKMNKYCYIDNIEFYLFRKKFINVLYKNKLKHIIDDFFALGSFLILQADKVKSIGYVGYVTSKDNDISLNLLKQYKESKKYLLTTDSKYTEIWNDHIADVLLKRSTYLKGKDYRKYLDSLRKNKIFDLIRMNFLNKWIMCSYPKLYYKLKKIKYSK